MTPELYTIHVLHWTKKKVSTSWINKNQVNKLRSQNSIFCLRTTRGRVLTTGLKITGATRDNNLLCSTYLAKFSKMHQIYQKNLNQNLIWPYDVRFESLQPQFQTVCLVQKSPPHHQTYGGGNASCLCVFRKPQLWQRHLGTLSNSSPFWQKTFS